MVSTKQSPATTTDSKLSLILWPALTSQLQAVPLIIGNNRQNNLQQSPGVNGEIDGVRLMAHARSHRNVCKSAFGSSCSGAIAYHPTSSQYEISMQIKDIFFLFSNYRGLPSFAPQTLNMYCNLFWINFWSRVSQRLPLWCLCKECTAASMHTLACSSALHRVCANLDAMRGEAGKAIGQPLVCFGCFFFFALIFCSFFAFLGFSTCNNICIYIYIINNLNLLCGYFSCSPFLLPSFVPSHFPELPFPSMTASSRNATFGFRFESFSVSSGFHF